MTFTRRRTLLLSAAAACIVAPRLVLGATRTVRLAVGGRTAIYYLPITVAERRGLFQAQGLEVDVTDFAGGSKALQALVGGSADIGAGSFEHVISMHAKGQPIESVSIMGRYSGVAVALRAARAAGYKEPAQLAGMKFGVTAPGSGTHLFLKSWLTRHKVDPAGVSVIGVGNGAGAVAALRQGELDGIAHFDPVMSQLEAGEPLHMLVDGRTTAGMEAAYGGPYAAATLYATPDYIARNGDTVQAIVNAIQGGLEWMATASPEAVAAIVPPSYYSDAGLYLAALKKNLASFAPRIQMNDETAANVYRAMAAFDPQVAGKAVTYAKTYTNRFVLASANGARA